MTAIACVIRNRADFPRWWGGPGVVSVCLHPGQFACWHDHNRIAMARATAAEPAFATALDVAARTLNGQLADITENADHYYDPSGVRRAPAWVARAVHTVTVAGSPFYRAELPAPT